MARQQVNEATFAKASVVTIPSLDGYLKPVTVYGQSTQASTPTPDVPVAIVSTTGNVTVRSASPSKNLFDSGYGITIGFYYDGFGTAQASAADYIQTAYIPVLPNTTYTMSHSGTATPKILQYTAGKAFISRDYTISTSSKTVTTGATTYFIRLSSHLAQLSTTQLELGATATAYVAHNVSTATLPLGTTQLRSLPNGVSDRIYKSGSSWFLEQNVHAVNLNGSESWSDASIESGYFRATVGTGMMFKSRIGMNDRFTERGNTAHGAYEYKFSQDANAAGPIFIQVLISRLSANTIAAFKTWLAANPVIALSDLATPITTTITDPTLITALENIRTYDHVTTITADTPIAGTYLPDTLRTQATNRVATQDIKSSLSFNGTSSKVALTQTAGLPLYSSNTAYTILAWVKPNSNLGAQVNGVYTEGSTSGTSPYFSFTITNTSPKIGYFIRDDSATVRGSYETATRLKLNEWNRVAFVDNNGTVKVYINGVEDANSVAGSFNYTRTGAFTFGTSTWGAATRNTTSFYLNGSLSNCRLYKSALTLAQTELAFNGGEPDAANRVGKYDFQEGAGTTAYDSSGNGNNGTITNGTFTSDVPTKKRGVVGGNLVYNGDFSYAPPFTAATNTQYRSINGTAGGSNTPENLFGWGISSITGTCSAQYDNGAMKLSTTATSSKIDVKYLANASYKFPFLPMLPNTSYTLTARVKTNLISGSATTGARLHVLGLNGGMTTSNTYTVVNGLVSTKEWTDYSLTFTTSASVRFFDIVMSVVGNDGAATLIMDAWFSNIELRPTTPVTRGVAS